MLVNNIKLKMGCAMEGIENRQLKDMSAAIGIGSMIIFIAMVLVAGISASVLIQTSTSLEMQALQTAQETTSAVASGLLIDAIEGNATATSINKIAIEVRPRAGSPDIDINQTVIEISDSSEKHILRHSGNSATNKSSINGAIFNVSNFGSTTTFDVIILQDADNSVYDNTVISYGDHIILAVNTESVFSGLSPRTDIFGSVICEEGAPGIIGFTTPSAYADTVIELQ